MGRALSRVVPTVASGGGEGFLTSASYPILEQIGGFALTTPTNDLFERLIRLETKIDMFLERLVAEQQRTADHETRLRKVERWQYALPPTVLVALISGAAAVWR